MTSLSDLSQAELRELRDLALRAVSLARGIVLDVYARGAETLWKTDGTPVTEADRRAELALREFFAKETPEFGFLGEEFGEAPGRCPMRWVVDPIDGTKSFVHRVPLFGSLVGLERDGEPLVGVIACHAVGEVVDAAAGLGARWNGEPCRVSNVERLDEATIVTSGVDEMARRAPGALERLATGVRLFRTWGDCFGYLLVATGRAEGMLDPVLERWDLVAVTVAVREAGGCLDPWPGATARLSAVASNGRVQEDLLALLRG